MRALHVASEALPYSKTGGLADVAAALPAAQARLGVEASLITPWYGPLSRLGDAVPDAEELGEVSVGTPFPWTTARIVASWQGEVRRLFVCRPEFFDREDLYGPPGEAYFDNPQRFIFFARAALAASDAFVRPQVIHCHDWQAALVPALVRHRAVPEHEPTPATVTTIHNLAFQGLCDAALFADTGLPPEAFNPNEGEFYGQLSLLKAGLAASDAITTVSPSYAEEILTPEFGFGLEGFLAANRHKLTGIVNGIDTDEWNPAADVHLPAQYRAGDLSGKRAAALALAEECGLAAPGPKTLLAGFVGRLTGQKGVDLIADASEGLLERGFRLVVLGRGDADIEARLTRLQQSHADRFALFLQYDDALAHRIIAGADVFLMPSRFEPCGLTQLYAMTYGTLPIVAPRGGLRDTVCPHPGPKSTGFLMRKPTAEALLEAAEAARQLHARPKAWRAVQGRAMRLDVSWAGSASRYVELYQALPRS